MDKEVICCVEQCENIVLAKKLCNKHYIRVRRHGDLYAYNIKRRKIIDRLEIHIERITESGCWIWKGDSVSGGYGRINMYGELELAHRISYRENIGEIPDGFCVLHKCDVPDCVNPNHLFIGTHQDNTDDMKKKGRWGSRKLRG